MSFHVVVDGSEAWVDNEITVAYKELNKTLNADRQYVSSLADVGQESLFGDVPISVIRLNDVNAVKSFVEQWEKSDDDHIGELISHGLIVATTVNRNSTRKLEAIGKKWGTVHLAKENSKDKTSPASKMLAQTNLTSQVKKHILDWIGDDYSQAIPVINDIMVLAPAAQKKVTVEDVMLRMPLPPGSVPPWDIEKPLMNGDVKAAISSWRRISEHSHPLVITSLMKKKISLLLRISTVMKIEGKSISVSSMAQRLGESDNYPFKLSYESARVRDYAMIVKASETIFALEKNLKGGSKADQDVLVETALINLCKYLRK